jgi:lysyl-tRNA synthetase, class II
MNILELSEQEIGRRQSLQELRDMGIEPYPAAEFPVNAYSTDIREQFSDDAEPRQVSVAGRLMGRRVMGKASFAEVQDSKGRMQIYVSRDEICPGEDKDLYNKVFKKLMDIGDFIGVKGYVFRTQTGEISIHAQEITLLSKSLKPLPIVKYKDGVAYDKFDDPELRYRQRYVDLIVNDGVKNTFLQRATVLRTIRQVLDNAGYTEVETPTLQAIAGGASARPFITHFNALNIDMYMRIATELYLKRLIVGGFEGVYEIGKNFRNEGMDRNHNPEFTCMELYVQYKDYNWMMSFTEKLLETVCIAVNGKPEREIDGKIISFKAPYRRLPILDAIKEKTGFDCDGKSEEEIRDFCKQKGMEVDETMGKGKLIDELFGEFCEGTYIQPTFITFLNPLTHRVKVGSEVARCRENTLTILTLALTVELLPPFAHEVELWLIVNQDFNLLASLCIESVTCSCILSSDVLAERNVLATSLLHALSALYELLDVETCACDRQQTNWSENRETTTYVVRDDE